MQYDIFISYRREGGDMMAHILYERLTQKGYRVFQDIESLRSGKFNTAIYEKIEQCKDFILVLPPHALDRCSTQDDWIRNEIAYALEKKKNIIPVMLRGFSWPKNMPEDIKSIQFFNGLTANAEYFDQFVDKLTNFLVTSKKTVHTNNYGQTHHIRIFLIIFIIVLFLASPAIVIFLLHQPFGFLWRIGYFISLVVIAKIALNLIETRPSIAASCFGTLTEDDLNEPPDIIFSRVSSCFGKNILISKTANEKFLDYYELKKLSFGTWDGQRTNYLKIIFRRGFEWYDPSIFYLHTLSKGGQAVKMLTRQGFILQTLPNFINADADYLTKNDFHVFIFYRKRNLDYVVVYHCDISELQEKYETIGV